MPFVDSTKVGYENDAFAELARGVERKSEREKEGGPGKIPDDGVWVLGWGSLLSLVYISSFRVGGYRWL
jgi:hypothetical protein